MPSLDALRAAAAEQAVRLQSDFIGTEHLFLAWLTWARGPIADAISAAGLNADTFQEVLAKGGKRGRGRRGGPAPGEPGSLTSHAQRVLEMAIERGRAAGREEPGTDDLVLAIVQEPRGAIARALTEFDIKPSRLKALASDRPARGPKAAGTRQPAAPVAAPVPAPEKQSRGRTPASAPPQRERPAPRQEPQTVEPAREEAPEPSSSRHRPSLDLGARGRFGLLSPLYLAVPAALGLHFAGASTYLVCLAAALGAIPLAALLGEATEQLVARSSPLGASILAATLGNGAMLVFAVAALRHGHPTLAVASVAGSLLAGLTLLPGLGLLRSWSRGGGQAGPPIGVPGMLVCAVALALLPTGVEATVSGGASGRGLLLTETFALVLAAAALLSLGLIWRSGRPILGGMQWTGAPPAGAWSTRTATGLALLGLAGVVAMAELVLGSFDPSGVAALISPVFLGLVVLPLLGSAPQQGTAVTAAARGHRDLAFQQLSVSGTLLVLVAVPVLVAVAGLIGVPALGLSFGRFEAMVLVGGALAGGAVMSEREPAGIEGALLIAGYVMAAVVAWFI